MSGLNILNAAGTSPQQPSGTPANSASHQYLMVWGMFFTRHFRGATRIYTGWCHYTYNSGIRAEPVGGEHGGNGKGVVVFSIMEANIFQHLLQDLLYVIEAHRPLLSDPETAIALPENPQAEAFLRLMGIKNPIIRLPWRGEAVVPGPVTVVDFLTFANPATDDREWGRLCALAIPYRRAWLERLRVGLEAIAPSRVQDLLIWVSRRGTRAWADEGALAAGLTEVARRHGLTLFRFAPDDPAARDTPTSLLDRLCLFRRARAVVATNGGSALHVVALQPGAAFLEVTVPNSYSLDWWIDAADLRYRRFRATTGSHFSAEPVVVSPAEIARQLEETMQGDIVPARGWLRPDGGRL